MKKSAVISDDGLFRYSLTRQWGEDPNNLLYLSKDTKLIPFNKK